MQNIIINEIKEGMTGSLVADLLYDNFLELNKGKAPISSVDDIAALGTRLDELEKRIEEVHFERPTVKVGTVVGVRGAEPHIENSGTPNNVVLDFVLPSANPITIGDTITGAPGTKAKVVNKGTEFAANLEFTVPQGPVGLLGPLGIKGDSGVTLGSTVVTQELGNNPDVLMSQKAISDLTGMNSVPKFSTSVLYRTDDIVEYNGLLYQFVSDYKGSWDGSKVKNTSLHLCIENKLSKSDGNQGYIRYDGILSEQQNKLPYHYVQGNYKLHIIDSLAKYTLLKIKEEFLDGSVNYSYATFDTIIERDKPLKGIQLYVEKSDLLSAGNFSYEIQTGVYLKTNQKIEKQNNELREAIKDGDGIYNFIVSEDTYYRPLSFKPIKNHSAIYIYANIKNNSKLYVEVRELGTGSYVSTVRTLSKDNNLLYIPDWLYTDKTITFLSEDTIDTYDVHIKINDEAYSQVTKTEHNKYINSLIGGIVQAEYTISSQWDLTQAIEQYNNNDGYVIYSLINNIVLTKEILLPKRAIINFNDFSISCSSSNSAFLTSPFMEMSDERDLPLLLYNHKENYTPFKAHEFKCPLNGLFRRLDKTVYLSDIINKNVIHRVLAIFPGHTIILDKDIEMTTNSEGEPNSIADNVLFISDGKSRIITKNDLYYSGIYIKGNGVKLQGICGCYKIYVKGHGDVCDFSIKDCELDGISTDTWSMKTVYKIDCVHNNFSKTIKNQEFSSKKAIDLNFAKGGLFECNNIDGYTYGIYAKNTMGNIILFNDIKNIDVVGIGIMGVPTFKANGSNPICYANRDNIIRFNNINRTGEEGISFDCYENYGLNTATVTLVISENMPGCSTLTTKKVKVSLIKKDSQTVYYKNGCFIISLKKGDNLKYTEIKDVVDNGDNTFTITCNYNYFNNVEVGDKFIIAKVAYNNHIYQNNITDAMTGISLYGDVIGNVVENNKIHSTNVFVTTTDLGIKELRTSWQMYVMGIHDESGKGLYPLYARPAIGNVICNNILLDAAEELLSLSATDKKYTKNHPSEPTQQDKWDKVIEYFTYNNIIENNTVGLIKVKDTLSTRLKTNVYESETIEGNTDLKRIDYNM